MAKNPKTVALAGAGIMALGMLTAAASDQPTTPFGGEEDVDFAGALWEALVDEQLAGPGRINVYPFQGSEPHGSIQQVLGAELALDGRNGEVLVKHNHGGEDATLESVYERPNQYLAAITVMYKREEGYDPENQNWFWAKYLPDGTLDRNAAGKQLAGRVAKGTEGGCISCHRGLGGEDLKTLTTQ